MLPLCLSCLSVSCLLCLLAHITNAAVVTLDGEVVSVDFAHNVFVNGVEVLAGSPTPTGTLSSRFVTSATAASSGYPASNIGDGATDSTRGHTNNVRSRFSSATTSEPAKSTRSSKRTDSLSSSDRFNVRSTVSTTRSSTDVLEVPLSRSTQHTSTIDSSSHHSVSVSSNIFLATNIGVDYSLGYGDVRTSSSTFNKVASQFFATSTRSFATLTQDHGDTSLVGSEAASTDATSTIRTSDGTITEDTPDPTLTSETTTSFSPLRSATAATPSSTMVRHNSQPIGSPNHGEGGGVVISPVNPKIGGSGGFEGSGGSGSNQVEDPSDPENSKTKANSMEKPSTLSQPQLVSSTLASARSFTTSFTSNARSTQTSTSAISQTGTANSTSSVTSVSTSCLTCSTCLDNHFSPTTTPDPLDDDYNGDVKKRRFIDRVEKRAASVNIVAKSCTVATYTKKPAYPAPRNVAINERRPAKELSAFFATATYWAIPTPATCNGVPGWTFMNTQQIENLTYKLGGNVRPYVSIDHVYEVSLLEQFFTDQVAGGFTCSDIATLFDVHNSSTTGTRLNTIFG